MKLQLPPPVNPTTVLVFGAGMAGLVSALELKDAGYEVKSIMRVDDSLEKIRAEAKVAK